MNLLGDDGHVSLEIVVQIKGGARGVEDSDGSHFEGIELSLNVNKMMRCQWNRSISPLTVDGQDGYM